VFRFLLIAFGGVSVSLPGWFFLVLLQIPYYFIKKPVLKPFLSRLKGWAGFAEFTLFLGIFRFFSHFKNRNFSSWNFS